MTCWLGNYQGLVHTVNLTPICSKADPTEGMNCAARGGHTAIVTLLLDRGADPTEGFEGEESLCAFF